MLTNYIEGMAYMELVQDCGRFLVILSRSQLVLNTVWSSAMNLIKTCSTVHFRLLLR